VLKKVTMQRILDAHGRVNPPPAAGPPRGIVFVPEHVQVLTLHEFGGTAAESAEYRAYGPCCPRDRGGCCPKTIGCCPKQEGCCP
jgi:hypothetical protein